MRTRVPGRGHRRDGSRRSERPHLLMIDELVSDPRYGAGYPRAEKLVEAIVAAGWTVTFYPMIASNAEVRWMRGRFTSDVRVMDGNGARPLARLMRTSIGRFDGVLVSRPDTALAFNALCDRVPAFLEGTYYIYDAEALVAPRERSRRELLGFPFSPSQYRQALDDELRLLGRANAIAAVSPLDAEIFEKSTTASVHVVNHRIDAKPGQRTFDDRSDLLFIGRLAGDPLRSPNIDSLLWFVNDVMPALDRHLGTAYRLHVIGLVISPEIEALASDRVVLHGVVDALDAMYDRCRVFVAPTRFAAGIAIKVLEAFGAGLPCVVTPVLAAQLGVIDAEDVLIGSDADAFAGACLRLYREPALWTSVRRKALAKIESDFSAASFDRSVVALLGAAR